MDLVLFALSHQFRQPLVRPPREGLEEENKKVGNIESWSRDIIKRSFARFSVVVLLYGISIQSDHDFLVLLMTLLGYAYYSGSVEAIP